MDFDIQSMHIEDGSPEGRVIEAIVKRDHITPEEAIRVGLRELADSVKTPAEQLWGAFSSPEDADILDRAMEFVQERRKLDVPRDLGL